MFDVFITAISYLLLPTMIIILGKSLSKKTRNIICIVNCILVCLLWQIRGYYLIDGYKINFTTGLFYYLILSSIVNVIPETSNKFEDIKKNNPPVVKSTNHIKLKPKKSYIFLTTASLILNILLIIGVVILFSSNNNIIKQKKEYVKCIKKIQYNTNTIVNSFDHEDYEYEYILSEKEWNQLQDCLKKYNIKINE